MKNYHIIILAVLLSLSSCTTYSEWNRGTTGAYVGSMFGSLIGDIVGGPRGSSVGALVGGAAGAAIGVASAQADQERRHNNHKDYVYDDNIYYDNGRDYSYVAPTNPANVLEVSNVIFADENNNRCLEGGETAYVTFDIRNTGSRAIRNVAPVLTCDNRRIAISPTATIDRIDAGRGMRYKAIVRAQHNVRSGRATFVIGFADARGRMDPERTFQINVRR